MQRCYYPLFDLLDALLLLMAELALNKNFGVHLARTRRYFRLMPLHS